MNTKRITTEIAQAADAIRAGQLVAVPTETVYGLAGNGLDPAAVAQIYEIKGRPAVKPLSLMVHDASAMARYCADVPPAAYTLAEAFWPGPLTIVLRAQDCVPEIVRAGGQTVGLRCPDHPATLALINQNELLLAEQSLRFALDDVAGEYDVAIIDTAPSAKQLVLCAYVATSGRGDVIIPVKLDSTVMRGTASVVDSLRLVATKLRLPVPSWRILRTCVPGRMTNAEAVGEAILDRFFPDQQFCTVIHESAKVKEGSWEWKPIVEFMPGNRAAVDYGNPGRELGLWDE